MRILDCYFQPYFPMEGRPHPTESLIADLVTCIDAAFIFALVWSVGATTNEDGRKIFNCFLRQEMFANKFSWPFPPSGDRRFWILHYSFLSFFSLFSSFRLFHFFILYCTVFLFCQLFSLFHVYFSCLSSSSSSPLLSLFHRISTTSVSLPPSLYPHNRRVRLWLHLSLGN